MTTGLERPNHEILALCSRLGALSRQYGNFQSERAGNPISNDTGFTSLQPELSRLLALKKGGVGLFIGSGGLISLLPDLTIDVGVMIDLSPRVLAFNNLVADFIAQSQNPEEVISKLTDPEMRKTHRVLEEVYSQGYDSRGMREEIGLEATEYGSLHWTDADRFGFVKEALTKIPLVFIAADISAKGFGPALSRAVKMYGQRITVANLANVHEWIKDRDTSFVRNWYFDSDPIIIYSGHKDLEAGDFPKMHLTTSVDKYSREIKDELIYAQNRT